MNKKPLIITIVSLFIAFAVIGLIFYMQSFKTVHFDVVKNNIKVTVLKGESVVTSFTQDTDIRLQAGDYVFTTAGEDYVNEPRSFTVEDGDSSVTVDPPYSETYRTRVLTAELPAITSVLTNAYPILTSDFTIDRGDIYQDGSWYATTLIQKPNSFSEQGDMYRTVLKKEGDTWVIKAKPGLVLNKYEYPDVPFAILSDINDKR